MKNSVNYNMDKIFANGHGELHFNKQYSIHIDESNSEIIKRTLNYDAYQKITINMVHHCDQIKILCRYTW